MILEAPLKLAFLFYPVANVVYIFGEIASISHSNSSTASIGYLFVPIASLFVCLPWFVVGGLLKLWIQRQRNTE